MSQQFSECTVILAIKIEIVKLWSNWVMVTNVCESTLSQNTLKVWNIKESHKPTFKLTESCHQWQVDFITINSQVLNYNLNIGTTVPLLYSQ